MTVGNVNGYARRQSVIRRLDGTLTPTESPQLIDRLNALETDMRKRYVVTQGLERC